MSFQSCIRARKVNKWRESHNYYMSTQFPDCSLDGGVFITFGELSKSRKEKEKNQIFVDVHFSFILSKTCGAFDKHVQADI